jgi:hypothetical protein
MPPALNPFRRSRGRRQKALSDICEHSLPTRQRSPHRRTPRKDFPEGYAASPWLVPAFFSTLVIFFSFDPASTQAVSVARCTVAQFSFQLNGPIYLPAPYSPIPPLISLLLRMTGIEVLLAAIAKTARPSFVPRTLRHRGTWLRTMIANPRHRRLRHSREPIH